MNNRPDIDLLVPGEPRGKARPRFNRATGRAYTASSTLRAEQRIQMEWLAAGRPTVEGPLSIAIDLVMARPSTHLKKDGSLSASGARLPRPTKKPDWDNVGKLVADSLNTLAYRDDCQIVLAQLEKRWAVGDEQEHTRIRIWEMGE